MSNINSRLNKIEKALNVGKEKEKRIGELVWFGGGEPPEDFDNGYNIIHYVKYEDVCQRYKAT